MKKIVFVGISTLVLCSCKTETWIFNTKTCLGNVGIYDESKNKNVNVTSTQNDIMWHDLRMQIIEQYYGAKIKGGSLYIVVVESRKKDKEEIKEVICDYWKLNKPLPRFQK